MAKRRMDTEEARTEAPRGSTITWPRAQRVTLDQTTASKMEVETEGTPNLEKVSAEIKT